MVVTYGAADIESRAFVMSREYLLSLFDWSSHCDRHTIDEPLMQQQPEADDVMDGPNAWGALQLDPRCMDAALHSADVCTRTDRSILLGCCLPPYSIFFSSVCGLW